MNFFIAKIFEMYSNNEDFNAVFRTRIFLTALLVATLSSFALIIFETTSNFIFHKKLPIHPITIAITLSIFIFFSDKYLKKQLTEEKLKHLKAKYQRKRLHALVVYLVMITLFITMLFAGAIFSIIINGGEIFGEKIKGILQ